MDEKELNHALKLCTPNQIKEICIKLELKDYYNLLYLVYAKRTKLFNCEYILNCSRKKICKDLKFCKDKILTAVNGNDLETKNTIIRLLNREQ